MRSGAIIYPILSTYGALTDLVASTNFFALRAQQPTSVPYLVYREISTIPLNTKGDSQDTSNDPRIRQRSIVDTSRVQISVFAQNYLDVENIAVKVREALDREWGTVNSPYENDIYVDSIVFESSVDDYDDDAANSGVFIKHLDFIIRANRLNISNTWVNTYSLNFDGVDDYVTFGDNDLWSINSSGGDRGFSISVWVRPVEEEASAQYIINKNYEWGSGAYHYEYELKISYDNYVKFIVYFGDSSSNYVTFTPAQAILDDQWTHIVLTYDLSSSVNAFNFYINNALKNNANSGATATLTGSYGTPSNTICPLLMAKNGSTNYANMFIDELSIWDEVLSADDVSKLYGSGATGDPNRYPVASDYLVGYWRNGDGATFPNIPDDSPQYSNQGVMTNMSADDINTEVPS